MSDDELALPDDLLAVEALLVAVRDVARTPDMAARARAAGEAIGTRVETPAATTSTKTEKPKSERPKSEKPSSRPGRASARLSGEIGRLRSKVALLQLAGGLLGVVLLVGGYQWATLAVAPAPPPPKVIDDLSTLKTAQQRAQDGYRKASEGRLAKDRTEAERLFREAIGDLDAALAIYEELFSKYPGEKYEYLGPEFDRLSQTKMAIRKELMALAEVAAPGTAEEQARYAAATRQELLAHVEAALLLHAQLGLRLDGPMDDAWAVWSVSHDQDVRLAREALGNLKARHIVSPEARAIADLEEALQTMVRSARARALREGDPRPDWEASGDALRRLRAALVPADEVPATPEAADAEGLLGLGLDALARGEWELASELFRRVGAAPDHTAAQEERIRAAVTDAGRRRRLVEEAERDYRGAREERYLGHYSAMKLLVAWLPADDPMRSRCQRLHDDLLAYLQRQQRLLRQR